MRELHERKLGTLPDVAEIDPLAKIGFIALLLERDLSTVDPQSRYLISAPKKKRVLGLTSELITSLRHIVHSSEPEAPAIKQGYAQAFVLELNYMSLGVLETDSANLQGMTINEIKNRKRRIKVVLRTKTKYDTVVEAIQRGLVPIEKEQDPKYEQLSPVEEAVLHLSAGGWQASEMAKKYGVVQNSINYYSESIREKLGANSLLHAMRRAFELGIFQVGQEIRDPDEKYKHLKIQVGSQVFIPQKIGIIHPNELEVLSAIGREGGKAFTVEGLGLKFHSPINVRNGDASYGALVRNVANKINTATGMTVIEHKIVRRGDKRVKIHYVRGPLTISNVDPVLELAQSQQPQGKKAREPKSVADTGQQVKPPPEGSTYPYDPQQRWHVISTMTLPYLKKERDIVLAYINDQPELIPLLYAIESEIAHKKTFE